MITLLFSLILFNDINEINNNIVTINQNLTNIQTIKISPITAIHDLLQTATYYSQFHQRGGLVYIQIAFVLYCTINTFRTWYRIADVSVPNRAAYGFLYHGDGFIRSFGKYFNDISTGTDLVSNDYGDRLMLIYFPYNM
ncbi:MAG: hypothetical protein Ta2E_00160 [Mycoplasmoidaceae bacterium]|nr:MAG: hypothetical protein Ta2E_00160 [Mycoplasmoidaceae bacterium]